MTRTDEPRPAQKLATGHLGERSPGRVEGTRTTALKETTAQPLIGRRIAVTASRRSDELVALLTRRGAEVCAAAAVRMLPVVDDDAILAVTRACIENPPDVVVATTGVGFRMWVEQAHGWGMDAALLDSLREAKILARGPKAVGAVRAAGLRESWTAESEAMDEVIQHLLTMDLRGQRLVLQEYGQTSAITMAALRSVADDVFAVTSYLVEPLRSQALDELVRGVAARSFDAITFTSAPAVEAVLDTARKINVSEVFVDALHTDVAAVCVGPITAGALHELGVPTVQPGRARLGAMVHALCEHLAHRPAQRRVHVGVHQLTIGAGEVLWDGRELDLTVAPMAVLRALAARPGEVLSRSELVRHLPGTNEVSPHAIEMTVARVRSAIGKSAIETVVKRGYRLAVDP